LGLKMDSHVANGEGAVETVRRDRDTETLSLGDGTSTPNDVNSHVEPWNNLLVAG
jgi:hypothetical protein